MSPDLQWVRPYDSELDLFGLTHRGDVRKHAHRGAGAGAEEMTGRPWHSPTA